MGGLLPGVLEVRLAPVDEGDPAGTVLEGVLPIVSAGPLGGSVGVVPGLDVADGPVSGDLAEEATRGANPVSKLASLCG